MESVISGLAHRWPQRSHFQTTILASERDKKKRKVGIFQARSRNYPILGAHQPPHHHLASIWSIEAAGIRLQLPAQLLTDRACSPARRNHSLPPYVDAMDDALPIAPGTHHNNVGNTASIPHARGKFSRKRWEKQKTPLRRLSYCWVLDQTG